MNWGEEADFKTVILVVAYYKRTERGLFIYTLSLSRWKFDALKRKQCKWTIEGLSKYGHWIPMYAVGIKMKIEL